MDTRRTLAALGLTLTLGLAACSHPHGMGPGQAPGAGPPGGWGMGPAMMGGGPGYWGMGGMGPGMMGGGWGMGHGMMGGPGWGLGQLDLSAEQRRRIAEIQEDVGRRQWGLMSTMHAQGGPMHGGAWDEAGERRAYEAMAALHKQMFELQVEARRRVMEVLTPAQREQLSRGGRGR